MAARQGKLRMIEGSRRPGGRRVTLFTTMGIALTHVIRCRFVVGLMTTVTVRSNRAEGTAGMALDTIQTGVPCGQREEVVGKDRLLPGRGCMTPLAIRSPAIGCMIRRGSNGQVVPMTEFTLDGSTAKEAGSGGGMATLAWRYRVNPIQGEPGAGVLGDQSHRVPGPLIVATLTVQSQGGSMRIGMTPAASTGHVDPDRPPVIMAAQAGGRGMGPFQGIAGLSGVIKGKILTHDVPSIRDVTEPAVTRKGLVRHKRPPRVIPALPGYRRTTIQ